MVEQYIRQRGQNNEAQLNHEDVFIHEINNIYIKHYLPLPQITEPKD